MTASIWNPGIPIGSSARTIRFDPTTTIAADNIQAAIEELDLELRPIVAGLASTVFASQGSSLVGFRAFGVGTSARNVRDKLLEKVSVKDFGAIGDGVTDDTVAMQAAHATGSLIYYPAGSYRFSKLANIPVGGGIVGDGQTKTVLISTDTSSDNLFPFTGGSPGGPGNALTFQHFTIQVGPLQKPAGAAISIAPVGSENTYASFHNVSTVYIPIGIDFVSASLFDVIGCKFLAYTLAGVKVANVFSTDAGDSCINSCVFSTPYATGTNAGVLQRSSGGLRIVNNKFLGGVFSYLLSYNVITGGGLGGAATSNLVIVGNSFELYLSAGVYFEQQGNAQFVNVTITGNQFGVMQGPNTVGIASDGNPAWLSVMTISSNIFNMMTVGLIYSIGLTNVNDVNISGNVFKFNGGATPRAAVFVNCTNIKVGTNTYSGLTNSPFSVAGGSKIILPKELQSGSAVVPGAGATAYGALNIFVAVPVIFPIPFLGTLTAQDIEVSIGATSGEVSASVVAITTAGGTTTGFTVTAISVNTNNATVNWKATGVI